MITSAMISSRLSEVDGLDIQKILDFITEMSAARTSLFYNSDRKQRYSELDLEGLASLLDGAASHAIRFGVVKNKLRRANNVKHLSNQQYF